MSSLKGKDVMQGTHLVERIQEVKVLEVELDGGFLVFKRRLLVPEPEVLVDVVGGDVADAVAHDAPEDHVDDPGDERGEECEQRSERHENGAGPVVRGAAEPEEPCEPREPRADWDEDERCGEVVEEVVVQPAVTESA